MSHELFVELSDEQQQLVAGGALTGLVDILSTKYKLNQNVTALSVHQASGPNGSANIQQFTNVSNSIKTGAYKNFFVY